MKHNTSTTLFKLFVMAVVVLIFGVAAFGVGVSVGAVAQGRAQAAALPQVEVARDCACIPAEEPAPQAENPASPPEELAAQPATQPPATPPVSRQATSDSPFFDTDAGDSPLDIELFNEAWRLLEQQFYGDLPQGDEITYAAIRGVLASLDDRNTTFADPEEAAMFNMDMQGVFEGIGAQVDLADGGGVELEYLFEDQPAEKAGLRVGDIVIAVDGEDVTDLDLNTAISKIRGPRGTQVTLTIQREDEESFDITITRARIELQIVETERLGDGKVEYIALTDFSTLAPRRLAAALSAAVAKKPTGIVLDLRGNPGGLLDSAVQIGSYFVPDGNILIERYKDGTEEIHPRAGRYLLNDVPLVVLVDGGSASASEIVAGAIQDAGTGTLIGETTYGKGSVQLSNVLSDDSQLKVTIARWYTPKDRVIHGEGLEPDITVPFTDEDREAERDPQLDRAVEYLLQGK
jgi:carboxyl-terminal processing protease